MADEKTLINLSITKTPDDNGCAYTGSPGCAPTASTMSVTTERPDEVLRLLALAGIIPSVANITGSSEEDGAAVCDDQHELETDAVDPLCVNTPQVTPEVGQEPTEEESGAPEGETVTAVIPLYDTEDEETEEVENEEAEVEEGLVGGVVGAVAGAAVGSPVAGALAGSAIGDAISPDEEEKNESEEVEENTVDSEEVEDKKSNTAYPNATVIKTNKGKEIGEIYPMEDEENQWGYLLYSTDFGKDMIDSKEDALEALKDDYEERSSKKVTESVSEYLARLSGLPVVKKTIDESRLLEVANVSEKVLDGLHRLGRKMIDHATKTSGRSDGNFRELNNFSRIGEELVALGEPFATPLQKFPREDLEFIADKLGMTFEKFARVARLRESTCMESFSEYPAEKYGIKVGDVVKIDRNHPKYPNRQGRVISLDLDDLDIELLMPNGRTCVVDVRDTLIVESTVNLRPYNGDDVAPMSKKVSNGDQDLVNKSGDNPLDDKNAERSTGCRTIRESLDAIAGIKKQSDLTESSSETVYMAQAIAELPKGQSYAEIISMLLLDDNKTITTEDIQNALDNSDKFTFVEIRNILKDETGNDLEESEYLDSYEGYKEFASGMRVKFTDEYAGNNFGEVFTLVSWDEEDRKGRIEDENGRGWYVKDYQIEEVVAESIETTESDNEGKIYFTIDTEKANEAVMKRFGSIIDFAGSDDEVAYFVPEKYWGQVQEVAFDNGGEAREVTGDFEAYDETLEEGSTYSPKTPYGVKYVVFAGKEGRAVGKEAWFKSAEAMERGIEKIENLDNFYEIKGRHFPEGTESIEETETLNEKTPNPILAAKRTLEDNHVFDVISRKKDGSIIGKRGYFYKMGMSPESLKEKLLSFIPNAIVIDTGDHWAPFRGGAKTGSAGSSYMWVQFKLPEQDVSNDETIVTEKAPPGMEQWVKQNKANFKKQYGDEEGTKILYATANKMAKESIETLAKSLNEKFEKFSV